ncbi:PREDICTED: DE-cadherin [Nicrophorus vespilloides]|uniref:DE-cadherin n=1 Tax=Nicrophorus vespilloides TaxID=110193 RepID=A0ABM1M5Z4_NICVS|nr:PREDICTED: DE-cadherin [Nicrophorus vespilloides]
MDLIRTFWILCSIFALAASVQDFEELPLNFPNVENDSSLTGKLKVARVSTDNTDNHKPIFTDCSTYNPSIKEEQERGLHVITVHANDSDPPENGGTITYAIVKRDGDRNYFTINNKTGEITTNLASEFDRDEPTRLKEIYITVQATDNGRPILADICTFKVVIEDINDNAPTFDQYDYNQKVAEDTPIDREVMRVIAYDIDDGVNAKITYSIKNDGTSAANEFDQYFIMANDTGVITLRKALSDKKTQFFSTVLAKDNPINPLDAKETTANVIINVVGADKKPPLFTKYPLTTTQLQENYHDYTNPIVTLSATSNIAKPDVIFDLDKGLTTQTNKDNTFIIEQNGTDAYIKLGRALDYETVTDYQLTIRCTNQDSWSVMRTIDIKILDVNDEIPAFIELVTGSVLENELPDAEVMQVRAIDKDGTSANNIVSYELVDHTELFKIDPNNGKVTTNTSFDREKQNVYNVNIKARDNSPSALTKKPYNSALQTFRITIEDRNDNKPTFTKDPYTAQRIPENTDIGKVVIEVKAVDVDTASLIKYEIIEGNINNAFNIESTTGRIMVFSELDFEKIENYNLTIRASDGVFNDTTHVHIEISNVNDELPVFEFYNKNISIAEESIPENCIITLKAYDPDIKDRNADQKIVYRVEEKMTRTLLVDKSGCVKLIKKLDRDKPFGFAAVQAYILAYDDNDSLTSKSQSAEIYIILEDINDNRPFLNITEVVWYENGLANQVITQLQADDYDGPDNGPPFKFNISPNVGELITSKFYIENDQLYAKDVFDREEKKFYDIPIEITDSGIPPLTGISILRVIIGDENDNEAKDGESSIFVYNYNWPDIEIGRVYVDDPDDWDLNDKVFTWDKQNENFMLNSDNGSIIMKSGTQDGEYRLKFIVTEEHLPLIPKHQVYATVTITVKSIPEVAVKKSGSVRLSGTSIEDFVGKSNNNLSKRDMLQNHLHKVLNTSSIDNVDVLTVLKSPSNVSLIDVRFSAHGSPYYSPEKLNSKISLHQEHLESTLKVKFDMISIDACMQEDVCTDSCTNELNIGDMPAVVMTNQTSFVGVNAIVTADCHCSLTQPEPCEGCEMLGIGFMGNGWATYHKFETCMYPDIRLEIAPQNENGLIFYAGPMVYNPFPYNRDFMSLELRDGYPVLLLDYGSGTTEVILRHKNLNDGASHIIKISLREKEILLSVDDCQQSSCQVLKEPIGPNNKLNVNGPLQIGGLIKNIDAMGKYLKWEYRPTNVGFTGCIRNLTFNNFVYNLSNPGDSWNANPNCNYGVARAVSFGIDSNFLLVILLCLGTIAVLFLAVVVHRRKQDHWGGKDIDDIRETIISYEDEGGGEGDTGFDLSVLRRVKDYQADYPITEKSQEALPDISGFLDHKKVNCDRDANSYPFDDVRYYAYEGDGNSTGSLSSLASCTDDGDLKFNYLSSFGPRFRKLADMYGEDPSDVDSQDGTEESWC